MRSTKCGQSLLNENTLTFDRTFNKRHHLNVVAGVTVQEYKFSSFRGTAWDVPRESLGISGLDEGRGAAAQLLEVDQPHGVGTGPREL